ncbi:MAG TPA: hypothetical protein VFD32_02405 [Dehalococcoidia bacterium]|nr:hypothetical protein [Dehalococcoidia bacterium]
MESPLSLVYIDERCNACGSSYPLSLHEIYLKQQVKAEWQTARPCPDCDQQRERLVPALPADDLTRVEEAWNALAQVLDARGIAYYLHQPKGGAGRTAHTAGS